MGHICPMGRSRVNYTFDSENTHVLGILFFKSELMIICLQLFIITHNSIINQTLQSGVFS